MRDNSVETIDFPHVHHAPVRTPCPAHWLRQEQFSPLQLGDCDLPV